METRVWWTSIVLLLVFLRQTWGKPHTFSSSAVCSVPSITDSILQFEELCLNSNVDSVTNFFVLTEGDETSLQKALNLVHSSRQEYVSVLFYASWCPFSRTSRLTFTHLSSLFPSIRHLAVKESAIKPSTLSRYGVHGFPTLFLLNSTYRMRYHGSRTVSSLSAFYSDATGIKPALQDQVPLEKMGYPTDLAKLEDAEQDNCPFSWARFPENLFQEEMYLALATTFVLLRLIYFVSPSLLACACYTWMKHNILNISLVSLWEHLLLALMQVLNALKRPFCKTSNMQERAMNARSWASKSLASVSFSESVGGGS
ncbi:Thioredoxin-like fold [Macleaya cordata]|uniref:Thioredoxin-like fold n=1 Tax=Macleaya cordata TaxID=56857 RepID=A0A200PN49_MACCD|nr:Thioredoxin-like fold [Macleaya cordata]